MRRVGIGIVLAVALVRPAGAQDDLVRRYRDAADRIIDAALADSAAYARLTELVDRFGPRFSGSDNLERALDWTLEEMRRDGLARVRGEPVPVPVWVRGQ
jgi:carboxypeptidase Q